MSNIKQNIVFSTILSTSNYIFPLIIYPYISRVLGVTNIGICSFVDGIIQYYCIFSMMGISYVAIREIAANRNEHIKLQTTFSSLISLNIISTLIMLIILLCSILFVPAFHKYSDLLLIGALKLVFNTFLIEWFYQGLEDFRYITIRTLIIKFIYVLAIFIFIRSKDDYALYYLLTCLLTAFNALVNIYHSKSILKFSLRSIKLKPYIKPFFIIGLYQLLVAMYTTFNSIYLGFVSGDNQVGYYTTAIKVHNIILCIFTALSGVLMPHIANLLSEGKINEFTALYHKSIDILFTFSFPIITVCIIFADQIIHWISGPGYEPAVPVMQLIIPLIFVVGYEQILIVQMLTPLKKDREILINSFVGSIFCLVSNIVLVPYLNSIGSAFAWIISELSVLLMAQYFVFKNVKLKFPIKLLFRYILISVPIAFVLIALHTWNPLGNFSIFLAGLITMAYYSLWEICIFKNELPLEFYKMLKGKICNCK